MKRKSSLDYLRGRNPSGRSFYIDYDYIDQLDEETLDYLMQFNSEYYGADFQINPTFLLENGKMIQVSCNEDRRKNRDLRSLKKAEKFYKLENGKFSSDVKYKYSSDIIHPEELRKSCNRSNNQRQRDVNSFININSDKYAKLGWAKEYLSKIDLGSNIVRSPEERKIMIEEVEESKLLCSKFQKPEQQKKKSKIKIRKGVRK